MEEIEQDALKIGARNSAADAERLQTIHDYAVENGAKCGEGMKAEPDIVATFGAVKALGGGKVGGYLVQFGDEKKTDLAGDFFAPDTYFGNAEAVDVYYHHGLDATIKRRVIGSASLRVDNVGVWAETQLAMRDEYERQIYKMAEAGKLGWSSGSAAHLVEREHVGTAAKITRWPIVEASLTPTPAEPRNVVMPIKSLISPAADADGVIPTTPEPLKEIEMEETQIKAMLEEAAKTAAETAVKKYADEVLPEIKAGYAISVKDEADRRVESGSPFKSATEFFKAVKQASISPHAIDQRLAAMRQAEIKASGVINEAIPSEGGFLVPTEYMTRIWDAVRVGEVMSRVAMDTPSGNTMVYNALKQPTAAGTSQFGGVVGYWLQEGGTKTASQPEFKQISLKLKKLAAVCVATDEILEDQNVLGQWLQRTVPLQMQFQAEDAFINGDGVGKPLGVRNSGALVSVTRTDANKILAGDVAGMWARRWTGSPANNYAWFVTPGAMVQLMTLTLGQTPIYTPPGGYSASPYGLLLGRPVIEVPYMPALGTTGDIMLADFGQYQAISKGGVQSAQSMHVYFLQDEQAFRFVYRVDGQSMWDTPITGYKDALTYSPFVVLTTSS